MYQFYYAVKTGKENIAPTKADISKLFGIEAVRPAMWEEHCLECSAPACFESCVHYLSRSDGRCKRFENGLLTFESEKACCNKACRVKFRKWGNMMTVIFPAMLDFNRYNKLSSECEKLGHFLYSIDRSFLPMGLRWQIIRTLEYLRRRCLRKLKGIPNGADAFVFHAYSYFPENFNLIVEVYDDHTPVWKTAISIKSGENISVITELSAECSRAGNLVKVYPENNIEAELDIYWCDFVKGASALPDTPSDKVKCVVWDLDNTLWDGILIETDEPIKLKLREGVLDVMSKLDERGIIQSIASKNDFEPAIRELERLGISDYFLYPQISWGMKSTALEEIAKCLNIGIDSLALVDDSNFERAEVNSRFPQVRTYSETDIPNLPERAEFDVPVTDESRNRRLMYKAEQKRSSVLSQNGADILGFLKESGISICIFTPTGEDEILRCFELASRTNQLNMTGHRYTQNEFKALLSSDKSKTFAFSCKDKYGEYGIVGFGMYDVNGEILEFSEFAMSCRVAGKFVESALFYALLNKESCKNGKFEVIKTKKNILLRDTLEIIGFKPLEENSNSVTYSFTSKLKNRNTVIVTDNL